ncbi:MAG: cytochrome b5-like heme/steroid binding domain-containing protein [Candidatus Diapherotrites archaeon]
MNSRALMLSALLAGLVTALLLSTGCVQGSAKTYTLQEVAQHNSPSDCWIALQGKVYNVTELLARTPENPLAQNCGTEVQYFGGLPPSDFNNFDRNNFDANRARDFNARPADFNSMDRNGPDPDRNQFGAQGMLSQYYIGDLQP